jgi:hypothetical protein
LLNTDQKLGDAWDGKWPDPNNEGRSGHDAHITYWLIKRGFSDDEIATVLWNFDYGKAQDHPNPEKYIATTINNERKFVAKQDSEKPIRITEQDAAVKPDSEVIFPKFDIDKCIPQYGLISDYLEYIDPLTDASDQFNVLTILQAISIATGSNYWIKWADQDLFLNLFTLRLGKSTYTRKSHTAWNTSLLLDDVVNAGDPSLLLATDHTLEGMIKELAGREKQGSPTTGFVIMSEMG